MPSINFVESKGQFYGVIPELTEVNATGKTQDECRLCLKDELEEWIGNRRLDGLPIPTI